MNLLRGIIELSQEGNPEPEVFSYVLQKHILNALQAFRLLLKRRDSPDGLSPFFIAEPLS